MGDSDSHVSSPVDEKAAFVAAKAAARPQLKSGSSNPNMNGPLYMQTSGSNVVLVRRLKRKDNGTWKHLARWFVENQIGLSFNLLALLFLAHFFIPKARAHTSKYFHLSYYNSETGKYGSGFDDAYFIVFCVVLFTGLRAGLMEHVLAPFAKANGISKRKELTRFSEQAWMFLYYLIFWTAGVYLYLVSPYYLNMAGLWNNWPIREMDGLMKGYMVAQWAFWLQQIIVINIEERRKDHWQMFSHHIVTTSLITACYAYHQTRVGHFILVLMDVVDLFLPLAKCLKYAGYTTVCDVLFAIFMASWVSARHIVYTMVCWSVYKDIPEIIPYGCYTGPDGAREGPTEMPSGFYAFAEPFFNYGGRVCWNNTIKWAFLLPLLALQVMNAIWFTFIIRVAIKVIRGEGAEDTRSDDEGDEEEEEEDFVYEEAQPLEEDVGVESLDLKSWERRSGIKKQASSSGVSLPGHSDRKELLGRIGCEKQVD